MHERKKSKNSFLIGYASAMDVAWQHLILEFTSFISISVICHEHLRFLNKCLFSRLLESDASTFCKPNNSKVDSFCKGMHSALNISPTSHQAKAH